MTDLSGKVAVVIGGSRGIGAAVSRGLARHGADVAFTHTTAREQAASVLRDIEHSGRRGKSIRADIADVDDVTAAVNEATDALGHLDVLVNNAALFPLGEPEEFNVSMVDKALDANVRAPFVASLTAARHMTDGASIVTIGSHIATRTVFPRFALYSMSKTALIGMTKGLSRDLGPRGITVNLVHPGPIDTDLNPAKGPGADAISGNTALGRYGTPDEVAATVVHLAGPGARYVTGTEITVDGGFNA